MEEAVVKKGLLYLQQQQTFGKKWRKFWGVLHREETCASARLELLEGSRPPTTEKARRGESGRRLISLHDCVHVGEASGEAHSPKETTPFLLQTTGKCYLLAAERGEAADWILELCEHAFVRSSGNWKPMQETDTLQGRGTALSMAENSLYSPMCKAAEKQFPVAVRATQASERCQLGGRFLLSVGADALALCDMLNGDVLYTWPYKFLRRFGHDKVIFSFEAGRRCISGEGNFEFATKQGSEIIQVIEAAIGAQRNSGMNDSRWGVSPNPSSSAALPATATSQAKYDEGAQGDQATTWGNRMPSHAVGTKSLSLEFSWQGKPAKGQLVKPMASCPLSNTKSPSEQLSEYQPRRDPQYGPKVWEWSGKMVAPQVKVVPELEYAEPLDMVSKPLGNTEDSHLRHSTQAAPHPSVSFDRTAGLGLASARVGPEHIYDDPEVLLQVVYDEPQEIKGEAWRLQAMADDPVGHEFPYNPCLGDYSVPKMGPYAPVQLPGQDKAGLGGMASEKVTQRYKNKKNAQ